ncbi:MAG TPA: hypothetical protein VK866_01130, partial [Acidimicrobiales bacterium]|nr:hypothetical protein [Acidimicrobiales bacterium]
SQHVIGEDGTVREIPTSGMATLSPGELMRSVSAGGAGYGDPTTRPPEAVAHDVSEGWITPERAAAVYSRPTQAAPPQVDEPAV